MDQTIVDIWCLLIFQQLRASSQLIYQFDNENTVMTVDGALSTSWLKNQQKEATSLVFPEESGSKSNCDTFYPWLQSSSVPGSVTQLVGSSYLVRVTSWELYGRYFFFFLLEVATLNQLLINWSLWVILSITGILFK